MSTNEQDIRVDILNALLTTPHRDLQKIWPVHEELIGKDPRFYVRLAAWYSDHGDVRDHKEMFVVALALSEFEGHRDVGLALLRQFPPYEVLRVVDFIGGRKTTRAARKGDEQKALKGASKRTRQNIARRLFGPAPAETVSAEAAPTEPGKITEEFGLFRNIPRTMKTEVGRYLAEREADPEWFDGCVLTAQGDEAAVRTVARSPGRARAEDPVREGPARGESAVRAADVGRGQEPGRAGPGDRRASDSVSCGSHGGSSDDTHGVGGSDRADEPSGIDQQPGALRRRGALDVPEIKTLVEAKLTEAKTAGRVNALKAGRAIEAAGVSDDLRKQLEEVADTQIKARGRISRPTTLLVDKSSSMHEAIELGKRIGSMVSAICESELYVYAFDTIAHEITAKGKSMADWERAFQGITAGGSTSCGVALKYLERRGQHVEQVVLISDEEQNTPPTFVDALRDYGKARHVQPSVVIVRTPGGCDHVEKECRRENIPVDVFQFSGDYYSLPNLVPMLARPSRLELLMEIMDYPLPQRKTA